MATTPKTSLAATDDLDIEVDGGPRAGGRVPARRRGRPAGSDGLTGERILAAARECFAESGYAVASTHMVAARVGLTTGALYHHFGSKRELYMAVFDEVEQIVYDRFEAAAAPHERFVDKLEAMFDEAVKLRVDDPTLAGFLHSVTGDMARHPDLVEAVSTAWNRRDGFFAELVASGIASGEVAAADRKVVLDTVGTLMAGLIVVSHGMPVVQSRAVDGLKRLLSGALVKTAPAKGGRAPSRRRRTPS
jgi:AcrR family transcriptional regulator